MIDDMMAVLDANGWESANLVGLSSGGGLAQFAALQQPDRVRTLTLISAVPQYGNTILLFRYVRLPGPFRFVFRRYGDSPQEQTQMLVDVTTWRRRGAFRSTRTGSGTSLRNRCAGTPPIPAPGPASSQRAAQRDCPTAASPVSAGLCWP
jgi:pimeloyl-ACP methyl ester carboxylesterase